MEVGPNHSSIDAKVEISTSATAAVHPSTSSPLPPFPPPLPVQDFPFSWHESPAPDVAFRLTSEEGFHSLSSSPANPLFGHDNEDDAGPRRNNQTLLGAADLPLGGQANNMITQHSNANLESRQTNAEQELLSQAIQNQLTRASMTFCPPTYLQRQQHVGQHEFRSQPMQMNIMSHSLAGTNRNPSPAARAAVQDTVSPRHYFPASGISSFGETAYRGFNPLQLKNDVMAEEAAARLRNELMTNRVERSPQSTVSAKQVYNDTGECPSSLQRKPSQSQNSSFALTTTTFGRSNSDTSGDRSHLPQHHFLHRAHAPSPRLSQDRSVLPPPHGMPMGNEMMISPQPTMNIPGITFDSFVQWYSHPHVSQPSSRSNDYVVEAEKKFEESDDTKNDSANATTEKRKRRNSTKSIERKGTDGDAVRSGKESATNKLTKGKQGKSQPRAFSSAIDAMETEAAAPAQNEFIAPSVADGALAMQTTARLNGEMINIPANPFSSNVIAGRNYLSDDMTNVSPTATVSPQQLGSQVKSTDGTKKTRRKSKTTFQKKTTQTYRMSSQDSVVKVKRKSKERNQVSGSHKLEYNSQLGSTGSTTETNSNAARFEQTKYTSPSMPSHCNITKSERISPSLGKNDDCATPAGPSIVLDQTVGNVEQIVDNVPLQNHLQTQNDALSTCSFSASHIDSDDQDFADTFSEQHEFVSKVKEIYDVDSGRMEFIMVDSNVKKSNSLPKEPDVSECGTNSLAEDVAPNRINSATQSVANDPANLGETAEASSCENCCAFNGLGPTSDDASKRCLSCQAPREYAGLSSEGCDSGEIIDDRIPSQKCDEETTESQSSDRATLDGKTHNNPYSFERLGSGRKDLSRLLGGSSCNIPKNSDDSNEIQEGSTKGCVYQPNDGEKPTGCPTALATNENGAQATNIGMFNHSRSTDHAIGLMPNDSTNATEISDITSRDSDPKRRDSNPNRVTANRVSDSAEFDQSLSQQDSERIIPETSSIAINVDSGHSEDTKDGSEGLPHGVEFYSPTTSHHNSDASNTLARASNSSILDASISDRSGNNKNRGLSKEESEDNEVVVSQDNSCEQASGLKVKVAEDISPPSDLCKVVPRSEKRLNLRYPHAPMGQIWLNQSLRLTNSLKDGINLTTRGTLIGRRWVWDEGYFMDAHFNPALTMKDIPLPSGCTCGANHVNASPKLNKRSSSMSDSMNAGRMRRSERSCTSARMASVINQLASGTLSPHTLIACEDYTHGPEFRFSKTIATEDVQPFSVRVSPDATFLADLHAHLCDSEIIGFLGGHYSAKEKCIYIQATFPCKSTDRADSGYTDVEMDPVSQIYAREAIDTHGMSVVGWYHSHPTFQPDPSVTDIENQANYQQLFAETSNSAGSIVPFVGLIVGTYDSRNPTSQSVMRWFHVRKKETSTYKSVHFPMNLKTTDRRFRKMPGNESSLQQAREEMSIRGTDIRQALEARYLSCPLSNPSVAELPHDLLDRKISDTSKTDRDNHSEGSLACEREVGDTYSDLMVEGQIYDDLKLHSEPTLVPSPEDPVATIQGNTKILEKERTLLLSEGLFNYDLKAKDPNRIFPGARPLYFTEREKTMFDMQFGSASYDIIGGIIWHAVEREQHLSSSTSNGSSSLIPLGVPPSSGAIFELILRRSFTSVCDVNRRLYDIVHCVEGKTCDDLQLETAFDSCDAVLSHNVDVLISHYLSKSKKLSPFSSWNGSGDKGNIFKACGQFPSDDHEQWRDLYFTQILQMQRVETNGSVSYQGGTKMRRGHKMAACLLKWASCMQLSPNFARHAIDPEDSNTLSFDHEKELQLQSTQTTSGRSQNVHYYFVAEVMRLIAAKWRESEDRSSTPMKRVRRCDQEGDRNNDIDSSTLVTLKTRRKSRKKKLQGQT